jgi:hypothetical protein
MKASSRGRVAPWGRDWAGRAEGAAPDRQTTLTPRQPDIDKDGDLFPLALWNACACATNPISNAAGAGAGAGAVESIMCNQGSPARRVRMRSRAVVDDDDDDDESLWTSGKPAVVHFVDCGQRGALPSSLTFSLPLSVLSTTIKEHLSSVAMEGMNRGWLSESERRS